MKPPRVLVIGLEMGDERLILDWCASGHLPVLKNLSIKRLVLNPGAMRTPHWHANANELTGQNELDPISGFPNLKSVPCRVMRARPGADEGGN